MKGAKFDYHMLRHYLNSVIERILRRQVWSPNDDLQQYLQTHYSHAWGHKIPSPLADNASFDTEGANRYDVKNCFEAITDPSFKMFRLFSDRRRSLSCGEHENNILIWVKENLDMWEVLPPEPLDRSELRKKCLKALETADEQLLCMADLVERYPEVVKEACDPSPVPRVNWRHVAKKLRAQASQKILSNLGDFRCSGRFRFDMLPIVPSDDSLALFIAGITKILHTLPTELVQIVGCSIDGDAGRLRLSGIDDNEDDVVNEHIQDFDTPFLNLCQGIDRGFNPPSVLEDLKIAIKGMAFVHTLPDRDTGIRPRVLRTRWTPWSTDPFRSSLPPPPPPPPPPSITTSPQPPTSPQNQQEQTQQEDEPSTSPTPQPPIFLAPPVPHLDSLPASKHDSQCLHFYTRDYETSAYPWEELDWLAAYCRSVRFLAEALKEPGSPHPYQQALDRQAEIHAQIQRKRQERRRARQERIHSPYCHFWEYEWTMKGLDYRCHRGDKCRYYLRTKRARLDKNKA